MPGKKAIDLRHFLVERIEDGRQASICGKGRGLRLRSAAFRRRVTKRNGKIAREENPPGAPPGHLDEQTRGNAALQEFACSGHTQLQRLRHELW